MAWIESHQSLLTHRKLLRLSSLLRADKYKLIGHLQALWWWALDNADAEGNVELIFETEIASASGWPEKQSEAWVLALVRAGFLDSVDGTTYRLHNWYRYTWRLSDKRNASGAGAFGNHKRWHLDRNLIASDCSFCQSLATSGRASLSDIATSPHLPTDPPTIPTEPRDGQLRKPWRIYELDLEAGEYIKLKESFPGREITKEQREWANWVMEEEEERWPKNKMAAFTGWLKKHTA